MYQLTYIITVTTFLHLENRNSIRRNSQKTIKNNDEYSYDMYEREKEGEVIGFDKFIVDLKASLYKRSIHLIRDYKSFVLEVICPILLVVIGLFISNINFTSNSFPKELSLALLPKQTTTYNLVPFAVNDLDSSKIFISSDNEKFVNYSNQQFYPDALSALVDYNKYLSQKQNTENLSGYYVINTNNTSKVYDSVVFINLKSQDAAPIFLQDHLTKMISAISQKNVKISVNFY